MTRPQRSLLLARQTINAARREFLQRALRVVAGVAVAPAVASTVTCGDGDDDDDTTDTGSTDGTGGTNGTDGTGDTDTGSTTTDGDSSADTATGSTDGDSTNTTDAGSTETTETTETAGTDTTGDTQTGSDTEPDTGSTETAGTTDTDTETGTDTGADTGSTETGTDTGTDTEIATDTDGNPPPPAGSIKYGPIANLPAQGAIKGYSGKPYFVGYDAGGVYTMTSKCTHQQCNMNGSNGHIFATYVQCRCHGAKFDLNGAAAGSPARGPLQHYKMYLYQGDLYVNPAEPVAATDRLAI